MDIYQKFNVAENWKKQVHSCKVSKGSPFSELILKIVVSSGQFCICPFTKWNGMESNK
jgi:hypothetical protein